MRPLLALAITLLAAPAFAQSDASGRWVIEGEVDGDELVIHCDFEQDGTALDGVCHDYTPDGKAHPLTSGSVQGDTIRFTYRSRFLLIPFTAEFVGTLNGDRVSGRAGAVGRDGEFSGRRAR